MTEDEMRAQITALEDSLASLPPLVQAGVRTRMTDLQQKIDLIGYARLADDFLKLALPDRTAFKEAVEKAAKAQAQYIERLTWLEKALDLLDKIL